MYLMDTNEKKFSSQSFSSAVEHFVNNYSFPVCAHDYNGNFFAFNKEFLKLFGGKFESESKWIENIGFDSFIELRQAELQMQTLSVAYHLEKSCHINNKKFDVLFERFSLQEKDCFLWKFGGCIYKNKYLKRQLPLHKDIDDFVIKTKLLDSNEYNFLSLYVSGASHKLISQLLGQEYGSSRNKSSCILQKLNISNRDDAFIVAHLSEYIEPLVNNARKLILRYVNRL